MPRRTAQAAQPQAPLLDPEGPPRPFADDALLLTDAPVPGSQHPVRQREATGLSVETFQDWTALENVAAEWQELADTASETNAFYEPWMLLPALRNLSGRQRVEVMLVFGPPATPGGKRVLCGLFPTARRRGVVSLWRHRYCYLCAPLLRPGYERAALSRWLDALAFAAPCVRLEDLPGDGPVRLHLVDALNERRWPVLVTQAYTRAVMHAAPSAGDFLAQALPGKRRKELRRQRARLAELGALSCSELAAGSDPAPWVEEFLALESCGWKGRAGVAAAANASDRAFLTEMTAQAARLGRLQMLALRLDRKPVALKLNLRAGRGAFAFKIAFDESFSRFSPGVLLELDNVERAHRVGLRWMDSCAAPNRFMINHLWPDRREMQTLWFSTGGVLGSLAVALLPLLHFARARARRASPT